VCDKLSKTRTSSLDQLDWLIQMVCHANPNSYP
jgi:hypothetical protein